MCFNRCPGIYQYLGMQLKLNLYLPSIRIKYTSSDSLISLNTLVVSHGDGEKLEIGTFQGNQV